MSSCMLSALFLAKSSCSVSFSLSSQNLSHRLLHSLAGFVCGCGHITWHEGRYVAAEHEGRGQCQWREGPYNTIHLCRVLLSRLYDVATGSCWMRSTWLPQRLCNAFPVSWRDRRTPSSSLRSRECCTEGLLKKKKKLWAEAKYHLVKGIFFVEALQLRQSPKAHETVRRMGATVVWSTCILGLGLNLVILLPPYETMLLVILPGTMMH